MSHDLILNDLGRASIDVPIGDIFAGFNIDRERRSVEALRSTDIHQTIQNVACYLLDGGYARLLDDYKFWDHKYPRFSGHCHQMTPAMGALLMLLDIPVRYKEAYRVRDDLKEMVPPDEEPNDSMRSEFCAIGRIPYCALEVLTPDGPKLVSPKHLGLAGSTLLPKLMPFCYEERGRSLAHPADPSRSSIYLKRFQEGEFPIWAKQKMEHGSAVEPVEYFSTYKDIRLTM